MTSAIPEFQEFNRLLAQMALSKSNLLRFYLPEHSICQNVLQIRDRGAPGVEFLWDEFADVLSWAYETKPQGQKQILPGIDFSVGIIGFLILYIRIPRTDGKKELSVIRGPQQQLSLR